MLTSKSNRLFSSRLCTRLTRSPTALALILTAAATVQAASNYRRVDGPNSRAPLAPVYQPGDQFGIPSDDDPFPGGGVRQRSRFEMRDLETRDFDDEWPAPRAGRRPGGLGHFELRRFSDNEDTFGMMGPRRIDELPRRRPSLPKFDLSEPYRSVPQRSVRPRSIAPRTPAHADETPSAAERITRRYQDPAVLHMIGSISTEQTVAMYAETLELIETRHLAPPAPQVMVEHGVSNLLQALQLPAFAQANGLSIAPEQAQAFSRMLAMQMQQVQIRSTSDAVAALQTAIQSAQQLGVAPVVVGLEFEYGAIESLDRFSAFVPPETARRFNQQLGEAVVGVGVQIESADEGLRVLKVLSDGPAAQAGLQQGDVIVAVDGQPLAGRDLESASALISGPEGSNVTLSVARDPGQVSQVALARRSIELHSVTDVQILDPSAGVGYMKLETFAASSARDMEQALWALHQQGMRSLILDLRGDPGGLLTASVEIANLFLPSGTIVSTRGRTEADNTTQTAGREQTWKVPLVVLVDENSASASEILAAAIQENGRGTIVGRHTYGKGTVQTLLQLQSVSAGLRLTTAKFYSPSGREMAGAGVEPDVPVAAGSASSQADLTSDRDLQAGLEVARGSMPSRASRRSGR